MFSKKTAFVILPAVLLFFAGCAAPEIRDISPDLPVSVEEDAGPEAATGPEAAAGPEAEQDIPPPPIPRDEAALENARLVISRLRKSASRRDYPSGAVFANFREVRAGEIAPGKLYRSAHPALQGDPRFPWAQQLAENARVRSLINLAETPRQAADRGADIPWYQGFFARNAALALELDTDYTGPRFADQAKTALRFIAENRGPVLVHCGDGAEKTGLLCALLEALAGAAAEEIVADFMKSHENLYRLERGSDDWIALSAIPEDFLLTLSGRRDPGAVDLRQETETWLEETAGLAPEEIAAIREKLRAP